jgi:hypothetical protein
MSADNPNPPADGLAGEDAIVEVMLWIQSHTMGDPEKMEGLFTSRGIDPPAFAQAGGIMVATAVAMNQSPEDAVQAAFMTGGLLGAMLGRDYFTAEDAGENPDA